MSLIFECGHCGRPYDLPTSKAGKVGRCKRCGRKMFIPTRSTTRPVPTWADDEFEAAAPAPFAPLATAPEPRREALPPRAPVVRSGTDAPSVVPTLRQRSKRRRGWRIEVGSWSDDRPLVVGWRRFILGVWVVGLAVSGWVIWRQSLPRGAGSGTSAASIHRPTPPEPTPLDPGSLTPAEIQAHIQERMQAHQGRIQAQLDAVQRQREAMRPQARSRP